MTQRNGLRGSRWDQLVPVKATDTGTSCWAEIGTQHLGFRTFRPVKLPVPQVTP